MKEFKILISEKLQLKWLILFVLAHFPFLGFWCNFFFFFTFFYSLLSRSSVLTYSEYVSEFPLGVVTHYNSIIHKTVDKNCQGFIGLYCKMLSCFQLFFLTFFLNSWNRILLCFINLDLLRKRVDLVYFMLILVT